MKAVITLLFLFLHSHFSIAQKLVDVMNERITVNSTTSMTGYTRNITEAKLPSGTIGYVYRISVFKKGGAEINNGLFDILQKVPLNSIKIGSALTEYAIRQNDNFAVDCFIFTTDEDANAFYGKRDNNWSSCKSLPNRVSSCSSTSDCKNSSIWFGFRNNNISQGLDVYLEVVAIVDENIQNTNEYSFKITNSTNVTTNFQLSEDGFNWKNCSLRPNYIGTYNFKQPNIQFRISTEGRGFVRYKLNFSERQKISWNQQKNIFDLFNY